MSALHFWVILGIGLMLGILLSRKVPGRGWHFAPWTRIGRITGWIAIGGWTVVFAALLWSATGGSWQSQFLTFVPANAVGTGHTGKWLVETCAGDAPAIAQSTVPGVLTTTLLNGSAARLTWMLHGHTYQFVVQDQGQSVTVTETNPQAIACAADADW